jgi:hypothetical protein
MIGLPAEYRCLPKPSRLRLARMGQNSATHLKSMIREFSHKNLPITGSGLARPTGIVPKLSMDCKEK